MEYNHMIPPPTEGKGEKMTMSTQDLMSVVTFDW